MRRALLVLFAAIPLLAGACGGEAVVEPTAQAVEGTLPQQTTTLPKGNPANGKKAFASLGCAGCHTYKPANSNGQTGPDLDKLPQYAQQADQGPLDQFVETSIVNPSSFVQDGYQDVMPKSYGNLPQTQLADLVAFLTQK